MMELYAPAKINLYLDVLARRDDGYHDIETLFERISISDRLTVELSDEQTTINCDDENVPTGGDSLLMRTVMLFKKKAGINKDFKINIEKNIPVSAGLGGGSSDAATLLKGLNRITGNSLDNDDLVEIAYELGADVPFFLYDTSFAYGRARGDAIEKAEIPVKIWHILVTPPFGVSTKDVYEKASRFGLTNKNGVDRMMTSFSHVKDIKDIAENLHNDLQKITLEDFPVLNKVFSELQKAGAKGVLLSGSGPTCFGIFDEETVKTAEKQLKGIFTEQENWKVQIACTY